MGSQNSKVYEHQEYDRNNAEDIPFALDGKHPEIATGAFGTVHKVKGETGRFKGVGAARKVISFQATDLSTAKCKIKEEAEALRRARHGHVVSLIMTYFYNKSDNEADFVIIMHRADGSLQDYLADKDSRPHEQWFGCLMGAVAHIHRLGIRHRDIKPTNILVKDEKVLLADFGISKRQLGGKIVTTTPDQPRARTEAYCAPEVERGGTRGRLADIFSLGAVFLEMLLAHSYPDQFRELEDHVGSGNDKSYAKSIDKVLSWMISILPWMNDTEQDPDSVDWRATLLFLCWQMLHKDRDQRPKAEDLRSWWILQPSVLGLESCNCIRDPAADGPEHYKLGKINESLRRAYENGHRLMVDFLIQRGAAISDTDSLVAASKGEMLDAVKRLLEMGADVLGKDKDGRTALHYAAGRGHEGVVQLLL
ncbi:kinase-like protein, partial [Lentithecium fluviatile CBS 122367]